MNIVNRSAAADKWVHVIRSAGCYPVVCII